MAFLVTVSFDLTEPKSSDYAKVEQSLAALSLFRSLPKGNGDLITLPYNTFAGLRNTPDAQSTIDAVTKELRMLSQFEGIRGKAFVSVAADATYGGFDF